MLNLLQELTMKLNFNIKPDTQTRTDLEESRASIHATE